jgi:hypothetical protein
MTDEVALREELARLRDVLGAQLVAYLATKRDALIVDAWIEGSEQPTDRIWQLLKFSFQMATIVASATDRETAQGWFTEANPLLDGFSPAQVIRNEPAGGSLWARLAHTAVDFTVE